MEKCKYALVLLVLIVCISHLLAFIGKSDTCLDYHLIDSISVGVQFDRYSASADQGQTFKESQEIGYTYDELNEPGKAIHDDTINRFIKLINEAQDKYMMLNLSLFQVPEQLNEYAKFPGGGKDDVQILYIGKLNDPEYLGHFMCIHFTNKENKINIYNPTGRKGSLGETQKEALRVLYPLTYKNIVWAKPKTTQHDSSSCGIFAIAYATQIIFGKDPKTTPLLLNKEGGDESIYLRSFLDNMLKTQELALFPSK